MSQYELIVIGAGPGGYVAAIRAAQLGMNVACIEKEPALGGTCLRVGCIPSKALLESSEIYAEAAGGLDEHGINCGDVTLDLAKMMKRKNKVVQTLTGGVKSLFKKNKIAHYQGHAKFTGRNTVSVESKDGTEELQGKKILIATGSVPSTLPGVEFDGDRIGSSTEALSYPEVPEHLVVIGAGVIGLELGAVWRRLGSKVTVLEYLDRILPGMDNELATEAHKLFIKQGLEFHLGTRVTGVKCEGDKCTVEIDGADPITCDRVLVAVGRRPNTQNLGLEDVGVKLDDRGRILVGEHFQTSIEGVYAIGDVIDGILRR